MTGTTGTTIELVKTKLGRPRFWTTERLTDLGEKMIKWLNESDDNLFFEEFLLKEGLYGSLIGEQCETSPEFSQIIKEAKKIQEWKLNRLALTGKIHPVYTIFLQKNISGYKDKQDVEHTGDLGFNLNMNLVPVVPQILLPETPSVPVDSIEPLPEQIKIEKGKEENDINENEN